MATKPKTQIMSHDDTVMSPITKASNVLFEDGKTAQDKLEDNVEKSFTPSVENSSSMFKVGQGDNVDYSGNVVDGAYDSCVLKGRTLVNCIQEPSSQDVVLPYEFTEGQYVTINDTKESGALGVELKGRTLVNLYPRKDKITISTRVHTGVVKLNYPNKINTKYLCLFEVSNINLDSNTSLVLSVRGYGVNDDFKATPLEGVRVKENGIHKFIWTGSETAFKNILFGVSGSMNINAPSFDIANIMLIEYQQGMESWDIPYFEGMTSVKAPTVKTVGKNLFDGKIKNNTNINGNTGEEGEDGLRRTISVNFTKVKPGTQYMLTRPVQQGNVGARYYDINCKFLSAQNLQWEKSVAFTTPTNCFYFKFIDEANALQECYQIEEGSTATAYEAYQTSSVTLPEEVILRSLPNGVCDTYNTRTGEYVQRIGETTIEELSRFTSFSSYAWSNLSSHGAYQLVNIVNHINVNCNAHGQNMWSDNYAWAASYHGGSYDNPNDNLPNVFLAFSNDGHLRLMVRKTLIKPDSPQDVTANDIMDWGRQNVILSTRIQYQLKTPIITKVDPKSVLKPHNTKTHIYSEIPENSLYPILSHSNPTYPVILKPSTKYSIVANSYSNGHTNAAINFNLGGATASTTVGNRVTTITTPSTLSNELLTMSGRGNKLNNVMVIEGDVVGDEPYFEGICDVKSPILSNTGKNLINALNCSARMGAIILSKEQNCITFKTPNAWGGLVYHLYLKPNTTYTFSFEGDSVDTRGYVRYKTGMSDWSGGYGGSNKYTFTTDGLGVVMFTIESATVRDSVTVKNIMIEEATTKNLYEPHKSNTTTFNQKDGKIIVLRSLPNGVCDTLNVETGEYVRRIGEVVLNGSEGWSRQYSEATPLMSCNIEDLIVKEHKMWCDKLQNISIYSSNANMGICSITGGSKGSLRVRTPLVLNGQTVTDFKAWLQANPITVQYQLATPIISTIDVQGFPYAYKGGHVQLSSSHTSQSLTPKIEYSLPINRNGQIRMNQVMVEKHQKHIDKLQAMIITNMVNTQYRQSLTKINYQLGGE